MPSGPDPAWLREARGFLATPARGAREPRLRHDRQRDAHRLRREPDRRDGPVAPRERLLRQLDAEPRDPARAARRRRAGSVRLVLTRTPGPPERRLARAPEEE